MQSCPYLVTVTKGKNGELNYEKSRRGQLAWRTFYNKLYEKGGNSVPSKNVRLRIDDTGCEVVSVSVAGSSIGTEHEV